MILCTYLSATLCWPVHTRMCDGVVRVCVCVYSMYVCICVWCMHGGMQGEVKMSCTSTCRSTTSHDACSDVSYRIVERAGQGSLDR